MAHPSDPGVTRIMDPTGAVGGKGVSWDQEQIFVIDLCFPHRPKNVHHQDISSFSKLFS